MVQSLIVTLREGVEAALVIGIAVAYLSKSGRGHLVRVVYYALAAAILAEHHEEDKKKDAEGGGFLLRGDIL